MDTEKLTTMSRDAVSAAIRNALAAGNPTVEPQHLLGIGDAVRGRHGQSGRLRHLLRAAVFLPAAVPASACSPV